MGILPLIHPVPIVLVGVKNPLDGEKANFTNIGDIAVAGLNPPLIMISLNKKHLAREGIDTYSKFCICVPEAKNMAEVDYCGMVSGRNKDKSSMFDWHWDDGEVPVIGSMPVNLICRPIEKITVEQRVIYVARVIKQVLREDVEEKGVTGLTTLMYGLDNNYYSSGDIVGKGYSEGKKIKEPD